MSATQVAFVMNSAGFTLLEIVIALFVSAITSLALMSSFSTANKLLMATNARSELVQEAIFIFSRFRADILVDNTQSNIHPVVLQGDYPLFPLVGSNGDSAKQSSQLAVRKMGLRDCRGYHLGHNGDVHFMLINHYFVHNKKLMCRGYDADVLSGKIAATGHNRHRAVALTENIEHFESDYLILKKSVGKANIILRVNALALSKLSAHQYELMETRINLILRSEILYPVSRKQVFPLPNKRSLTFNDRHVRAQFQSSMSFRNAPE